MFTFYFDTCLDKKVGVVKTSGFLGLGWVIKDDLQMTCEEKHLAKWLQRLRENLSLSTVSLL